MATAQNTRPIPVVLTGHALKSLRSSGYTLPAALGEVIDNSIEADANRVQVLLEESSDRGKRHISRIAIADDGAGMGVLEDGTDVLQHYLQLGFSTRYMSETTIGKFGVGAKLAALNFAQRIDVWTRTDGTAPWRHVFFDLSEAIQAEEQGRDSTIDPPDELAVPDDLEYLLEDDGAGTLVVWSQVDRLEEGRWADDADALRVDVEKELSRTFRRFLAGGIELRVNDTRLLPHDPLFLMERTWAEKILAKEAKRLANKERKRAEADGRDPDPAVVNVPDHFPARVIGREKLRIVGFESDLVVTLYPQAATRPRGQGRDDLASALRIPENQGAISFVRLDREINYTNVPRIFPRGVQEADRYIGIEVSFAPELDEYFGVRNVKRGVEPHGELRKQIREHLRKHLAQARELLQQQWGEVERETKQHEGEHADIVNAAAEANRTLPKGRAKGEHTGAPDPKGKALETLAGETGKKGKKRDDYVERTKDLPFVLESVDFPGQSFIDIVHVDGQVIIRVNTRHRFYRELWEPIRRIADQDPGIVSGAEAVQTARRTREALALLIIAYGKAESMHPQPHEQYGELRNFWGTFLDSLMGKVKDVV